MTAYTWPAALPRPTQVSRRLVDNTGRSISPLTGDLSRRDRTGERWSCTATWENLVGGARHDVLAFFLQGVVGNHTFELPTWELETATASSRGVWSGAPLVRTAPLFNGSALEIKGAAADVVGWARAGDWVRVGGVNDQCVRMVVSDADTDGVGDTVLDVRPRIRDPIAVDELVTGSNVTPLLGSYVLMDELEFTTSDRLASGQPHGPLTLSFLDVGR